ncbi:DUF3103 family protein [Microscilla marina]|uniref:Lipoprotein, putative n=1 Tax=Microscilla marina ATCC 23134 TaxID=313606 RepID=A1ZH35_MICM2|nr:DUF3103 family protein [Microscilla marina]EAY30304.1 lipoprotein, putative [Microscilla marina ATCC 23134]
MRKPFIRNILLAVTLTYGMLACNQRQQEVSPQPNVVLSKANIVTDLDQDMADFAQALAKSLESADLRNFVKQEAAKRFDGDYDILFGKASSAKIAGKSFRQYIEANLPTNKQRTTNKEVLIDRILSQNPLLNIAVPVHLHNWKTGVYTPKVAVLPEGYDDRTTSHIKAFDASGKAYWIDAQNEPDEPVIVVGWNERLKTSGQYQQYLQSNKRLIALCEEEMKRKTPYYTMPNGRESFYIIEPCDGGGLGGGGGSTGGSGPTGGDPNPGCYRSIDKVERLNGMYFTKAGLNYYEGWPAGAPEVDVRIFVGDIAHNFTKEKEVRFYDNLEPRKRKDIKDKWWNPGNKSLFMWDEDKVGQVFLAHFVEDDQQIKILNREIPIPIKFIPFVNVTVTIKIDSRDEEIGYMIVDQCAAPPDTKDGRASYNVNQYFSFSLSR